MINNGTSCEKCPDYHWPDEETATYCIAIEYTHYTFKSTMALGYLYIYIYIYIYNIKNIYNFFNFKNIII